MFDPMTISWRSFNSLATPTSKKLRSHCTIIDLRRSKPTLPGRRLRMMGSIQSNDHRIDAGSSQFITINGCSGRSGSGGRRSRCARRGLCNDRHLVERPGAADAEDRVKNGDGADRTQSPSGIDRRTHGHAHCVAGKCSMPCLVSEQEKGPAPGRAGRGERPDQSPLRRDQISDRPSSPSTSTSEA
jgi:hypothetical protein